MPTDVFRVPEATLLFAAEDTQSAEGTVAGALITQYELSNAVGRLTELSIAVSVDVRPFYEIGRRVPGQLRPGLVGISGSAERAHVNGALLRLLLGGAVDSPPSTAPFVQPVFNVITTLRDVARPDAMVKLTAFGVRFDGWTFNVGLTRDFVIEAVTFQAARLAFEET